jgi:glycosyltransferase involved in cell wall biosynthesis
LPRELWELVVVDDGSLDGTASVAAGQADILMRLPGPPRGPAYARNRGVEASLGAILVFVDADVCVHVDALRRIAWAFARRPELGAVFGNYDANPPEPDDISQYRNLRHHFVHRREAGETETFWAGCGAVRREAFVRAGRFDEWHFPRPQIEDVELGYRLRRLEYPILLDPRIEGTHLKRWRLREVIVADLRDRGVPWIRLQLTLGASDRPATLFFRRSEWINSGLVCASVLLLLLAVRLAAPNLALVAAGLLGMVLLFNHGLYRFFRRRRGLAFALRVVPIHLLFYLANGCAAAWAWILYHVIGAPAPPADVQAYAEKGLKTWPPQPTKTSWGGGSVRSPN